MRPVVTWRNALRVMHLATDVLGKIPERKDGVLGTAVKLLALADSAQKAFAPTRSSSFDLFDRYGAVERCSEAFVGLFFATAMHERFKVQRHAVDEYLEVIQATGTDGEHAFFLEYRYGRPEVAPRFYHTPRFDFAGASEQLWAAYCDGLYLSRGSERSESEVTFAAVPSPDLETLTDVGRDRLRDAVNTHRAAARDRQHRAYLLVGPRGTGKSSFAVRFARDLGGRLLKVDATSLPGMSVREVSFLVDALQPRCIVVDDFDRAPVEGAGARVLYLLEHLKGTHRGVTVFVTVNDATKLDGAMLRSGRIDQAIEFPLPDADERADLVLKLMVRYGLDLKASKLVRDTDKFNHADIAALVERTRREPVDRALASVRRLRGGEGRLRGDVTPTNLTPKHPKRFPMMQQLRVGDAVEFNTEVPGYEGQVVRGVVRDIPDNARVSVSLAPSAPKALGEYVFVKRAQLRVFFS